MYSKEWSGLTIWVGDTQDPWYANASPLKSVRTASPCIYSALLSSLILCFLMGVHNGPELSDEIEDQCFQCSTEIRTCMGNLVTISQLTICNNMYSASYFVPNLITILNHWPITLWCMNISLAQTFEDYRVFGFATRPQLLGIYVFDVEHHHKLESAPLFSRQLGTEVLNIGGSIHHLPLAPPLLLCLYSLLTTQGSWTLVGVRVVDREGGKWRTAVIIMSWLCPVNFIISNHWCRKEGLHWLMSLMIGYVSPTVCRQSSGHLSNI